MTTQHNEAGNIDMNSDEIVDTKAFFDVGGELGLGMGSDLTEMVAGTIFETETKNTSEERDTDKDPRKISGEEGSSTPRIVAIFHASFHPTKGNIIDWALKTDPDLSLAGIEFSVLPSGLHLVERDTIYFSHSPPSKSGADTTPGPYTGLALFRRRPTNAKGHRGFKLASLGVLIQKCERPRPWMLVSELERVIERVYRGGDRNQTLGSGEGSGSEVPEGDLLGLGAETEMGTTNFTASAKTEIGKTSMEEELTEEDFEPAREFFEQYKYTSDGEGSSERVNKADSWFGWSDELDSPYTIQSKPTNGDSPSVSAPSLAPSSSPTHHLPHLLRILNISCLTLYKFVLARKRILIYTLPPVEIAGVLAWVTSDLCREWFCQQQLSGSGLVPGSNPGLNSSPSSNQKAKASSSLNPEHGASSLGQSSNSGPGPTVLGIVTLSDVQRLKKESERGNGWIACTTDAIFLERPEWYDLVVDLTSSRPPPVGIMGGSGRSWWSGGEEAGGKGGETSRRGSVLAGGAGGGGKGTEGGGEAAAMTRPSMYMSKAKTTSTIGRDGKKKEKVSWKLENVRFTWSDVKLWTEIDRILKLDSSLSASHHSLHAHAHPHSHHHSHPHVHDYASVDCCQPYPYPPLVSSPSLGTSSGGSSGSSGGTSSSTMLGPSPSYSSSGPTSNTWAEALRFYEDVCLLCATLWMGLGTWRSNSRQSFSSSAGGAGTGSGAGGASSSNTTVKWGSARLPGDVDWSLEGVENAMNSNGSNSRDRGDGGEGEGTGMYMRVLGQGIEGVVVEQENSKKVRDSDNHSTSGRDTGMALKMRARGQGIEGKPISGSGHHRRRSSIGLGSGGGAGSGGGGKGHYRKPSASSASSLTSFMSFASRSKSLSSKKNAAVRVACFECSGSGSEEGEEGEGDERECEGEAQEEGVVGGTGDQDGSSERTITKQKAVVRSKEKEKERMKRWEREVERIREERRKQNVQTTLALLQTFHANTVFWVSRLREIVDSNLVSTSAGMRTELRYRDVVDVVTNNKGEEEVEGEEAGEEEDAVVITVTARDLLSLDLGVLSELDAKFVEWLVEAEGLGLEADDISSTASGSGDGGGRMRRRRRRRVVVKRGWQEFFGIMLGFK